MGSTDAQEYWSGVLAAGGSTTLPRWAARPAPGLARHATAVPDDLARRVRTLAGELGMPVASLVLAAHTAVLAALSGERDVVVGLVAVPGGPPLPLSLPDRPDAWRALALHVHRAQAELLAHRAHPVDQLRRTLGRPGPASEAVFDPHGRGGGLTGDAVLRTAVVDDAGSLVLTYRTDVLDAECAARIAGYHLTALTAMVADPEADHRRPSLLSPDELRVQRVGLAGRHRDLPARRVHELFEDQAETRPDDVAVVHRDQQWTYRELNARANRLARALHTRGLEREGVVAVVTERNPEWIASVLAVLKAGGVYLPIEPHFPADRIATTLSRAGCRLVVTESGSTASLDEALATRAGVQRVLIEDVEREDHDDADLGLPVDPAQLAYIYFTSGSTGEPKGAMCEHAGMLNHVLAKIDDLEIREHQVVAQTAPQCFDISLWQLVSALLVGGRTLVVEQDVILDAERFVDRIACGRVAVLQVVPSYLEVVLSYLEQHPRELPDLRYVSVTGEAVTKELVQRWFATMPAIPVVNAYGLTETSDDTNHEVMRAVPDGDRVPLGRPISNVLVSVVDEWLSPVPLGAPGEIVFSGVCIGRGYVNDPERTRLAFPPDPGDPSRRIYRSGDFGRWRPDGKLEFLGRRDAQVKVSGFRIEIGEVENALLGVAGVQTGAVVVAERPDRSKQLVAFYAGRRPLDSDLLRGRLARSLPGYMVPTVYHWRDALPLTANGKIDRKALAALAAELGEDTAYIAPRTPTERRLAEAWARVLDVPVDRISRQDDFFERGGTSLASVRLAIALDRAVSPKDLQRAPVLADLAELLDGRTPAQPDEPAPGESAPDGSRTLSRT